MDTIIDEIDPLQLFTPTPFKGQVIYNMEKDLCEMLLNWMLDEVSTRVKDN